MTLRTVLVVTGDEPLRSAVTSAMGERGYKVLTAATFAEGRKLLIDWQPEVLVTTVRLQDHNGLHLAIVSRLSSVLTKTIVVGYADTVLQAEARNAGALYLTDPTPDQVITAIESAVARHQRRWPRAQTNITARAEDEVVRLVDMSYGGFRLELAPGTVLAGRDRFDLTVGGLRVAALPVWMKQQPSDERVWCGAALADDGEAHMAWREFVDSALGHAIQ
jgi:DNA-binding response OmpR family regulator